MFSGTRADRRYEYTFELPRTLASHDWHPEGTIRHDLYAEIEGIPTSYFSFFRSNSPASSSRKSKSQSRHQSPSSSRQTSRPPSRTQSPARGENSFLSSIQTREPPTISLIQQVNTLPPVPSYEQSEYETSHPHKEGQDGTWLEGNFRVVRIVKLVYNPHPTGGINSLEERAGGEVPGIGGYDLMFRAPVVSLSLVRVLLPIYLSSLSTLFAYCDPWQISIPFLFHPCLCVSSLFHLIYLHNPPEHPLFLHESLILCVVSNAHEPQQQANN